MDKPTLSLAMIVKNESENIERCLQSILPAVDELCIVDTGSTDGTPEIIKEVAARFNVPLVMTLATPEKNPDMFIKTDAEHTDLNFAEARNQSFALALGTYVMWLDGDDTVENADGIKNVLQFMQDKGLTAANMVYRYEVDGDTDLTVHLKDRIVKRGMYAWEGLEPFWYVHENLYPTKEMRDAHKPFNVVDIKIRHWAKDVDQTSSGERNRRLLRAMLERMGDKPDPRAIFLMGRESFNLKDYITAETHLKKYIRMVEGTGDRLLACQLLVDMNLGAGNYDEALVYAMEAIRTYPASPSGYIAAARCYLLIGHYDDALAYVDDAMSRQNNEFSGAQVSPYQTMKLAAFVASEALKLQHKYKAAKKVISDFADLAISKDKTIVYEAIEELEKLIAGDEALNGFKTLARMEMVNQLEAAEGKKGEFKFNPKRIDSLLTYLPENLHLHNTVIDINRQMRRFKVHPRGSIALFCSLNFEHWDPETIIKNGGGGSETAVIEMASRWARAGYKVIVYADPEKPNTVYEGVEYKHWSEANFADEFDIFMSWRNPWIFNQIDIHAKRKYLWVQDIIDPKDYPFHMWQQLDKIIVLSQYQRDWLPAVPEDKFFYTTNGINLKLIEEVEAENKNIKRKEGYCVYASSADRGLEPLVRMTPIIKEYAPHFDPVWFYGWNSWNKIRKDKEAETWKNGMISLMKENGVKEGGRIGKRELYKEYLKADFWTYPLIGTAETSCITAMEAQALGAFPVTTGITALEETQQYGVKVPLENYANTLVNYLNRDITLVDTDSGKKRKLSKNEVNKHIESQRKEMMKWAREHFNWDRVAKTWIDDLFYGDLK